jgi:hypothetical protein
MRPLLWALVLALSLSGCASLKEFFSPGPAAPPLRSEPTPAEPSVHPAASTPAVPTMAAPAPPAPPPPQRPASPGGSPFRTVPAPPEPSPSPPPPVLSPQVSNEEDARLRGDAQNRMTGTETLMRQVDSKKLGGQQQENFRIIESLLASAKDALYARDTQRARTLAEKAFLLAEDLVRSLR